MSAVTYTEPFGIQDTHVSDVAFIDEIGPNLYRISYYSEKRFCYDRTAVERQIVAAFIVNGETLASMSRAAAEKVSAKAALSLVAPASASIN